jgi:predicted RNA-binding Zn-ribbon protein involved in translation (DUF1610 family)
MKSLIIIGIILLVFFINFFTILFISNNQQKKKYNNGICPNCGEPLEKFKEDKNLGRGYICKKCQYTTWVTNKKIDKKLNS